MFLNENDKQSKFFELNNLISQYDSGERKNINYEEYPKWVLILETLKKADIEENIYNNFLENPTHYKIVNNEIIYNSDWEQEEQEAEKQRISMLSLTKREVFLALYKAKEITPEQIKAQIQEPEALIEFEYANEYFRGNPLIDEIGEKLGYTSVDLDYLFENKELPAEALDAEADQAEDLNPSAVIKKI